MRAAVGRVGGGEDFAREARAAAEVEDEGGRVQVEEFEGAVSHRGLNGADAGGGRVFARFDVVVEEVRGEGVFGAGHGGGGERSGDEWVLCVIEVVLVVFSSRDRSIGA